ncbi:hypothetical protein EVAR_88007_1 [Eumeta japonica]|uniref:Uncharacterized protein n=1 Tax=Eumeta variegata TaxID=151549 RepID=A0A4C1VDT2_EUMVA|nr:hypothetical protein EVAR_88007_1 [Eumeta japonica]
MYTSWNAHAFHDSRTLTPATVKVFQSTVGYIGVHTVGPKHLDRVEFSRGSRRNNYDRVSAESLRYEGTGVPARTRTRFNFRPVKILRAYCRRGVFTPKLPRSRLPRDLKKDPPHDNNKKFEKVPLGGRGPLPARNNAALFG